MYLYNLSWRQLLLGSRVPLKTQWEQLLIVQETACRSISKVALWGQTRRPAHCLLVLDTVQTAYLCWLFSCLLRDSTVTERLDSEKGSVHSVIANGIELGAKINLLLYVAWGGGCFITATGMELTWKTRQSPTRWHGSGCSEKHGTLVTCSRGVCRNIGKSRLLLHRPKDKWILQRGGCGSRVPETSGKLSSLTKTKITGSWRDTKYLEPSSLCLLYN